MTLYKLEPQIVLHATVKAHMMVLIFRIGVPGGINN